MKTTEIILKTSAEWQEDHKNEFIVIDPDGWDRENHHYSWFEEEITIDEFLLRVSESTCHRVE